MTRFRDHQRSGTSAARRLGQAVTSAFRGTVLPFSKKWLTGNVVEAIGRTYVSGSGLVLDPLGSQAGIDTTVIALWLGHETVDTTQIHLHAHLELKERALARTAPPHNPPWRYRPPHTLLALLEGL